MIGVFASKVHLRRFLDWLGVVHSTKTEPDRSMVSLAIVPAMPWMALERANGVSLMRVSGVGDSSIRN